MAAARAEHGRLADAAQQLERQLKIVAKASDELAGGGGRQNRLMQRSGLSSAGDQVEPAAEAHAGARLLFTGR